MRILAGLVCVGYCRTMIGKIPGLIEVRLLHLYIVLAYQLMSDTCSQTVVQGW